MRLRLASYNIRKARGNDFRRHPGRILDVVNGLDADIVVLQEADHRLGDRPAAVPRSLIERETDFRIADLAANDVSLGWHGNAVLVRRRLTIGALERIPLPGLEPRGAVKADIFSGQQRIVVVGVHLALLRRWRRRQLAVIRDHLRPEERGAAIVAGDFNEWSPKDGVEPLGDMFQIVSPGRSFHAMRPVSALDRVALGHGLRLLGAGVEKSTLARISSDHLPIWVDAELSSGADDNAGWKAPTPRL